MADTITLGDGTRLINGWWLSDRTQDIKAYMDKMPVAFTSSDETFLMDFGGREKVYNLVGVLIDGNTLGTGGTFAGITNLEAQIEAIEEYFFDLDTSGITFTLKRYSGDSGVTGVPEGFNCKKSDPVHAMISFGFSIGGGL